MGRDITILKWSSLKELINKNPEFKKRYKTFDGKVWDKIEELSDDTLFTYINISASYCISRIASVMEKLFLPDHSVQIKLK